MSSTIFSRMVKLEKVGLELSLIKYFNVSMPYFKELFLLPPSFLKVTCNKELAFAIHNNLETFCTQLILFAPLEKVIWASHFSHAISIDLPRTTCTKCFISDPNGSTKFIKSMTSENHHCHYHLTTTPHSNHISHHIYVYYRNHCKSGPLEKKIWDQHQCPPILQTNWITLGFCSI